MITSLGSISNNHYMLFDWVVVYMQAEIISPLWFRWVRSCHPCILLQIGNRINYFFDWNLARLLPLSWSPLWTEYAYTSALPADLWNKFVQTCLDGYWRPWIGYLDFCRMELSRVASGAFNFMNKRFLTLKKNLLHRDCRSYLNTPNLVVNFATQLLDTHSAMQSYGLSTVVRLRLLH